MKIKIEQSGGIAGILKSKEMDVRDLPSAYADTVRNILNGKWTAPMRISVPRGAADLLNYKIIIQDAKKTHSIECNQYNIDERLKSLIKYIESSR